jgi:hypothetical protein
MADISTIGAKQRRKSGAPDGAPLTVPQVAQHYQAAESTVWGWIADGLLVATPIGGNLTRIFPEHLEDFERRRKEAAEAKAAERRAKSAA